MRIKLLNGRRIHPTITKVVKQRLKYCILFFLISRADNSSRHNFKSPHPQVELETLQTIRGKDLYLEKSRPQLFKNIIYSQSVDDHPKLTERTIIHSQQKPQSHKLNCTFLLASTDLLIDCMILFTFKQKGGCPNCLDMVSPF